MGWSGPAQDVIGVERGVDGRASSQLFKDRRGEGDGARDDWSGVLGAEDAGGGGECIGELAAGCDHSYGAAGLDAEAGAWVADVGVSAAVDLDELGGVTGS